MADAKGTCHLLGCPTKGTFDEHVRKPIGCPDDFTSYDTAPVPAGGVVISRQLLIRADSLLSALVHGRVAPSRLISDCDREEAQILSAAFREATR